MRTNNVWAHRLRAGPAEVHQLLVPAGDLEVVERDGLTLLESTRGCWPTRPLGQLAPPDTALFARLGRVASGRRPQLAGWEGDRGLRTRAEISDSYAGALRLDPGRPGLRRAQRGAVYSVLGHWESGLEDPALVVMPTGTGKTDTMIALMVAGAPELLLVVVPTAALRTQIGAAFERLGVLQDPAVQAAAATALRPAVCRLEHGLTESDQAQQIAQAATVVVTTPAALDACAEQARAALLERVTHLMIDEAHHSAAKSWAAIIDQVASPRTVLFTATPFREDGQALRGRIIFRFPLREAQREGYFTRIEHEAVLSLTDTHRAVAQKAIDRLDADLAAGYDHVLMARVATVTGARDLERLYRQLAPQHRPSAIHDKLDEPKRRGIIADLTAGRRRIVVCVDMLGEGFDLPQLKIAAIHDPRRSLGPMLQFLGRFVRTSGTIRLGSAAVFLARDPSLAATPLRALLREDADWNVLVQDMTDRAGEAVEELDAFEASFRGVPEQVPTSLLTPTMSAVAHRAPTDQWQPLRALDYFGADRVVGGDVAIGGTTGPTGGEGPPAGGVAWLIVESIAPVRWADTTPELQQQTYELIMMRFDPTRRLLCIHGSEKSSGYVELARAVLGQGAEPIRGTATFRVLSGLDRLVPTTAGLLDARDQFTRYSMHVGSDVAAALDNAEARGRTQTHLITHGFRDGEPDTICAALSGRFWSLRSAAGIKQWSDWCAEQAPKLLDDTIDLAQVFDGLIIPLDLTERPERILLAVEWPWELYLRTVIPTVTLGQDTHPAPDVEFVVEDHQRYGPFRFSVTTPSWTVPYLAEFHGSRGLHYSAADAEATIDTGRETYRLSDWLNRHKPLLLLEGDAVIDDHDRLLAPREDLPPFDPARLVAVDFQANGVDIRVESQRAERRQDSIQAFMSRYLREHDTFEVLIDDDRAGEAADLVGLHTNRRELTITLIHCKFSSSDRPGARVEDLYELCGQAMRGARWRQRGGAPLLQHLQRRVQDYATRTGGVSAFETGTIEDLVRIREIAPQLHIRFRTVLVQPGLRARTASHEQLRLLAGAQAYLRAAAHSTFTVYSSP